MSYITKFNQNITPSADNSSVSPLNAGLWFAGLATSTLGVAAIQISLKTDQNSMIYVDQSPGISAGVGTATITGTNTLNGTLTKFTRDLNIGDIIIFDPSGTPQTLTITSITSDTEAGVSTASDVGVAKAFNQYYWDVTDSYDYLSAVGNLGITIQAINSYVRVRVKNTSTVNQTYLRLQTVLTPIVEALPRSLDENGHLLTSVHNIEDEYGFEVENTPMGEMRTAQPIRIAGSSYEGNTIDPNFLVSGASGTGASISQAGQLIITSGTANGAVAWAYTNRRGRYIGGTANRYRSVRRTDAGTANNTRRWGIGLVANYVLTISSATVVAGDIYTNNGQQFTIRVSGTVTSAVAFGTGNPGAGAQTYTRVSGVGPASLTGSNFASTFQITDGAWFQYTDTTFGIRVMAGGALVTGGNIDTGSFNGNWGGTYTPGITALPWEMYYSNTTVVFSVGGTTLHTFSLTTGLWTNTPTLHAFSDSTNTGAATSVNMYSRSATIYRLGNLASESTSRYITAATTTILKYAPGRLKRIIIGHMNLNAGSFDLYDGFSVSAPLIIDIQIPKNAALAPQTLEFDIPFHNGLTVVNAVACQVTVVYE